ncbi:hypothetical protein CBS63078_9745 [Aspergillus niger]|uniref:Contig An14c0180, genomic contig n=6 Tax=Aspergillus TaxID=5052 RepID=A2R3R8_ASPNC|nr:uncharacterized protein An14g05250 [Aspergillus niger]XP_025452177.1 NAD(P)-binding protein [Aspergillus niger CBS 101883]EHA27928.1 hypothetical protein ASPNIDRAFT_41870 [Aspergillus niger ATCC 1015]RDH25651.1 NAD(P)-binding protein [Aspergillus niger ATCC 13496]KAI2817507.1 hypothetical protein CBS115989_5955 [Aspergillus niger]KAI2829016.1 hypothetical protein CBS133816_4796 [Aspergillus niger]KAI2847002.1 hypothetical protein CBS11350_3533 [Aspergillus niger]|eukprot:XP_001401148.1 short-chain dehydrogenase [Aspergillus niger CBS 513.88]
MAAEQKLVLITGANQGIGFETAKNLILSDNYHVILGSRDPAKGEEAAKTLEAVPGIKGSVSSIQIDVTDDQSVDNAAAQIKAQYGRLDILVNNAAMSSMKHPPSREAMRQILDVNVVGALSTTEAFLDLLRNSSEKRLVFVSSSTGSISRAADPSSPFHIASATEYRASKAALNMMMVLYMCRLKDEGFKVFGADPGLCATNLTGDPESLRRRNAAEPSDGGERVATVVKGERDADVGKVLGVYGVSPF